MADITENNLMHGSNQGSNTELNDNDNDNFPETSEETEPGALNGITMPPRSPEHKEADTLPDLVLNSVLNSESDVTKGNTIEDADEAAEALLQLSQSDILPEDDPELPIGVLPVDAAPVPITLGNEDVLNAIENFKQNNNETGIVPSTNVNTNQEDTDNNSNEKENKNSYEMEDKETKLQNAYRSSPPTSPAKGSLVIVKHGIKRKKSKGRTYKCTRCDKHKKSTQELNKHYRLKHKPLMCGICNKLFDLPGTLKKHMYGHLDRPFKCNSCNENFHFESELGNHRVVHRTIHTHFCMAQNCGHSFM